jgi:hypothetical protein
MNISTKLQQITEDNQFDIDLSSVYHNEDTFSDFCDKVNDAIMSEEIIYYSEAIKYLMREDDSLGDSLDIASEYGYTTEQLNSELLGYVIISTKVN